MSSLGLVLQRIWSSLYLSYSECDSGRIDEACDHAREALEDARACGMALSESQALHCLVRALAKGENHDSERPQNLWRQSIEVSTRCGANPSVAQAQLELGMYLAKADNNAEAHHLINAALDAFRRMGMPHWINKAEQAASAWASRG